MDRIMTDIEIRKILIKDLEPNKGQIEDLPQNPRIIKDAKFKALVRSLKESPEMLNLRELIVYPYAEKFVIIAGNMRYRAAQELNMIELPCKILPIDTPVEKLREYAIKDNNPYGEDNWDILANEWNEEELRGWDVDMPELTEAKNKIEEREIIPFVKTHVLISFNPEKMIDIQEWLQKIKQIPGVEYEQSSN
jgi:ParB-like chromosome segregation protein Spo0J